MMRARPEVPSVATTPVSHQAHGTSQWVDLARSDAHKAPAEELAWIARAQQGDAAALDWLVRSQWDRVQRLLVRVFGPRHDLEDLVQTTFLETLRALPGFRRESSLATFVAGIAVRVGRRARRPTKVLAASRALDEVAELRSQAASADTRFEGAEALRRVQRIVMRLSEPKRVAFLLWAVQGMDVGEIAQVMQASVSATRSRIFYAQKELKASAARDPYLRDCLQEVLP
jgi:RNA polymerase sigma-70 factor (ECF subfamily)